MFVKFLRSFFWSILISLFSVPRSLEMISYSIGQYSHQPHNSIIAYFGVPFARLLHRNGLTKTLIIAAATTPNQIFNRLDPQNPWIDVSELHKISDLRISRPWNCETFGQEFSWPTASNCCWKELSRHACLHIYLPQLLHQLPLLLLPTNWIF